MSFDDDFKRLTGRDPFPWQTELWETLVSTPPDDWPRMVDIPTGLGKTSVVPIWVLAHAACSKLIPRRLVYVVNRRTVVDQTTEEVQRIRENLIRLNHPRIRHLGISTLRGQFADNQEWSTDPSRLAIVCGTVDMIGSRLLFSGYRSGFKSRPLHAGFLGQDALLIHDEAHLEPAFQELIEAIQREQEHESQDPSLPWPNLRVMALSATARDPGGDGETIDRAFTLTELERNPPAEIPEEPTKPIEHVWRRLRATKSLVFHEIEDDSALVRKVLDLAGKHGASSDAVVIYLRSVKDVLDVAAGLEKTGAKVSPLTGTMRGYERDLLLKKDSVFARFLSGANAEQAAYLVCTSAGEVGIDISADHMVCDLSTFDSMAQRLGRVNRRGGRKDTRVDIVHPTNFETEHKTLGRLNQRREKTLALLKRVEDRNACPFHLMRLDSKLRIAAFAPEPTILPATDILFDAWALTSIRGPMPGRPPVAPYLHGVAEWEPPRTSVAWREEVELITPNLIERNGKDYLQDLLEDYPLKPHELLNDTSRSVLSSLQDLAKKHPEDRVWIIDTAGQLHVSRLSQIADPSATKAAQQQPLIGAIADCTLLLPPNAGGLTDGGMLGGQKKQDKDRDPDYDIADLWMDEENKPRRERLFSDTPLPARRRNGLALVRSIDLEPDREEFAAPDDEEPNENDGPPKNNGRYWHWYVRPANAENATRASKAAVRLDAHTNHVLKHATDMVKDLGLPEDLQEAVKLAAEFHDLGKRRKIWQQSIGNPNPAEHYAKSGTAADGWRRSSPHDYRHEFGSVLDVLNPKQEYRQRLLLLAPEMQDVVLHLVAAHHGRARPHFNEEEICDPDYDSGVAEDASVETLRRYARLQRRYGRWGLAYLESLLRAADWAASAGSNDDPEKQE